MQSTVAPKPVAALVTNGLRQYRRVRTSLMTLQKHTASKIENLPKTEFYNFSSNESGDFAATPSAFALSTSVQPRCTSLQNFAFCAIPDRLQPPMARLGCRFVCTTPGFAQKKDTRPVGGRGISAFFSRFLFPKLFL